MSTGELYGPVQSSLEQGVVLRLCALLCCDSATSRNSRQPAGRDEISPGISHILYETGFFAHKELMRYDDGWLNTGVLAASYGADSHFTAIGPW